MRKTLLAGVVALAAAGTAMATTAPQKHVLNIALPDGRIQRIEYVGDVAPTVSFDHVAPVAMVDPAGDPFAMFDRIAADMQRQSDAMLRQVATMASRPGAIDAATFGKLPAGTVHYSFVSTSTGNGSCTRSVQWTSQGAKRQPRMVSQTSGDCSGAPARAVPVKAPAKAAVHAAGDPTT